MITEKHYWLNGKDKPILQLNNSIADIINSFQSSSSFHKTLPGYQPSPLYSLPELASKLGLKDIYVKNEGERFGISAVKMLGASWAMHLLSEQNPDLKGFCAATDGNHGHSVAWSSRRLERKAIIFVPRYTVKSRIAAIEAQDARVIIADGDYDKAVSLASEYSSISGFTLVQDMAWPEYEIVPAQITSGYYTQLTELKEQLSDINGAIDLVIIQSGNGTWPSAVSHFLRNQPDFSKTKIILTEPRESDCMLESLKSGAPQRTQGSQNTIMAGLNCGTPSTLAYSILSSEIDAALSIEDRYAKKAMKQFYHPDGNDPGIEAGESGSGGLAGLLALLEESEFHLLRKEMNISENSRVLLFNTEGITDPELLQNYLR